MLLWYGNNGFHEYIINENTAILYYTTVSCYRELLCNKKKICDSAKMQLHLESNFTKLAATKNN